VNIIIHYLFNPLDFGFNISIAYINVSTLEKTVGYTSRIKF